MGLEVKQSGGRRLQTNWPWPPTSTNTAMSMDWATARSELKIGLSGNLVRHASLTSTFPPVRDDLAAAKVCSANDPGWRERRNDYLKTDQLPAVLTGLAPFQEPNAGPSEAALVRGATVS